MKQNKPKTIGITGGVGSGKSEILRYIHTKYNAMVVDTDSIANGLKKKGQPGYAPIVSLLGEGILDADGQIDNKKMAAIVLSDEKILAQVNRLLHPLVANEVLSIIKEEKRLQRYDYLLIESALLIEAGYATIVEEIWYVHASFSVRRARLKFARRYDDKKIDDLFARQLTDEEFLKHADVVIENGVSLSGALEQVDRELGKNA